MVMDDENGASLRPHLKVRGGELCDRILQLHCNIGTQSALKL